MIRSMAAAAEQEEKKRQLLVQDQQQQIDPTQLEFCRVLWDFSSAAAGAGDGVMRGVDLEVRKGDIVAVLSKGDPFGQPSQWWKCRARDGRIGYLPGNFLEVMRRPQQQLQATPAAQPVAAIKDHPATPSISEAGSRTGSLTSTSTVTLPTTSGGVLSKPKMTEAGKQQRSG